jgi:hypothetical protein
MASSGQSPSDATKARDQFVAEKLLQAKQSVQKDCDQGEALRLFGEAAHPMMDSSSPEHTDKSGNPRVWNPAWPFGHSPNEWIGSETASNLTPQILASQKTMLNRMYDQVFDPDIRRKSMRSK